MESSKTKQPKILNYKNLKHEKYVYKQPYKTNQGIYLAPCTYQLSRHEIVPFYFETPKLKTVTGIVQTDKHFYIDLELQQSGEYGKFYDFLVKNDEKNITVCHENSNEWFGSVMPLSVIENYYKTPILLKSDGKLPVLRVRIPSHKGNILCEIYNDRKEQVSDYTFVEPDDYVVAILELNGLMFMNQTFVGNYELQKLKIFKDKVFRTIPEGYIFSDVNEKVDLNIGCDIDANILEHTVDIIRHKPSTPIVPITPIVPNMPSENIKSDNINTSNANFIDNTGNLDNTIEKIQNVTENLINENTYVKNIESLLSNVPDTIDDIPNSIYDSKIDIKSDNLVSIGNKPKSLFDLIKETTLCDLINHEDLFLTTSKYTNIFKNTSDSDNINIIDEINDTANDTTIREELGTNENIEKHKISVEHNTKEITKDNKNTPIRQPTPVIESTIEDIAEYNVDFDVPDNISMADYDLTDNEQDILDESESESEDGIDYNTLNDLEVMVFE